MKQIAFVAPDYSMLELARSVLSEKYPDMIIVKGLLSEGVAMAQTLSDAGVEIIIARGETAKMIRQAGLPVVTVDVSVTAFDLLRALRNAAAKGNKIAVVAFPKMVKDIEALAQAMNLDFKIYLLQKEEETEQKVTQAVDNGAEVILGGVVTGEAAEKQGCLFEIIQTGSEGISQAAEEAYRIFQAKKIEKEKAGLFSTVIDYAYEGIVAINDKGIVTVFNPMAEKFTGILQEDAIGKHIKKLLPFLQLERIITQPQEKFGQIFMMKDKDIVCNQLPIKNKNGVLGAVATLMDAGKVRQMEEKVRERLFSTGHVATKTQKDVIGESTAIKKVLHTAKQYALTQSSVLIFGETGSGKEVFAQTIHNYSDRKEKAFVAINCAALPGQILESELFGYVPGAFTGASQKGRTGLFEIAHGGTIFLDEIAEMDVTIQSKLLRVLEEKKVMRLGSDKLLPVDVRIIAASNKDLKECVREQKFRQDLYYRLNVLKLVLPSLRDRKKDIKLLCEHFLLQNKNRYGGLCFSKPAMQLLENYDWPGNVRELQNILQRLTAVCNCEEINERLVKEVLQEDFDFNINDISLPNEKETIKDVLDKTQWNYGKAAQLLGMHRSTLWRKMKKYDIMELN